jgi:hypothetical protein
VPLPAVQGPLRQRPGDPAGEPPAEGAAAARLEDEPGPPGVPELAGAPRQVTPEPGLFLEYAPIRRRYDAPYEKQSGPGQADGLAALDANLEVFPSGTAQILEYWLDVSRFSQWKRPAVKLPWRRDVVEADLTTYATRGIRHVTCFAVYVDADYRRGYGVRAFIREYGEAMGGARRD